MFVFSHTNLLLCDKPKLPQHIMVKPVVIHSNLLNYLSGSNLKYQSNMRCFFPLFQIPLVAFIQSLHAGCHTLWVDQWWFSTSVYTFYLLNSGSHWCRMTREQEHQPCSASWFHDYQAKPSAGFLFSCLFYSVSSSLKKEKYNILCRILYPDFQPWSLIK